jgi:UDP-2,3-diacylglucosamine pyrophosphatase LpxH
MQHTRFRSIWISDVHLGYQDCKAEFLLDFLHSIECETLYLVGDFIDFLHLRKGVRWPLSHNRVLQAVLALSLQGSRVVYVPGNHDYMARDYVGLSVAGIEIVRELIHETADGRRFLVTHGDDYEEAIRGGHPLKRWFGNWLYDLLLWLNRWTHFTRRSLNYPYWPLANALKQRIGRVVNYIARFERAAAEDARQRGLDGVICGHIHKAEIVPLDGVLYCNDGDWVESCTALIEHYDGALEIVYWADQKVVVLQERRPRLVPQPVPGMAKAG